MTLPPQRTLRLSLAPLALCAAIAASLTAQTTNHDDHSRPQFFQKLVAAAIERTQHTVRYDPGYVAIAYPGGDVPAESGVCTDEIIRSYRAVGIDLQKDVHEDMVKHFAAYQPGLRQKRPDANIDHRRVPNLMVFFSRKGENLPVTDRAQDYSPGDLVTWNLTADQGGNRPHIGIVVDKKSEATGRYMIVHNIGEGPKMEDVLFDWKITGHYRYVPEGRNTTETLRHEEKQKKSAAN